MEFLSSRRLGGHEPVVVRNDTTDWLLSFQDKRSQTPGPFVEPGGGFPRGASRSSTRVLQV